MAATRNLQQVLNYFVLHVMFYWNILVETKEKYQPGSLHLETSANDPTITTAKQKNILQYNIFMTNEPQPTVCLKEMAPVVFFNLFKFGKWVISSDFPFV